MYTLKTSSSGALMTSSADLLHAHRSQQHRVPHDTRTADTNVHLKESTAASRVRVSWGTRWHTQPSSAPSGSSCGGRESTGCASTNRRDRSLTVLLTKFILTVQTELHPRYRGLDKLVRGRSSSKTSPPVPLAGSREDGGAINMRARLEAQLLALRAV